VVIIFLGEIAKVFRIRLPPSFYYSGKLLSESYAPIVSHILLLVPILAAAQDCVISLYGLACSEASFALMARSLKTQSYRVQNLEFSTHSKIIAELVSDTIPQAVKACGY